MSENLISELTNGQQSSVEFGAKERLGFDADLWIKTYGSERPESTRKLEDYYRNISNEARIRNGFQPL